jgi:hypothetical protein
MSVSRRNAADADAMEREALRMEVRGASVAPRP